MAKHNKIAPTDDALDNDIIEQLSEAQTEIELPDSLIARMQKKMQQSIEKEQAGLQQGFETVRGDQGDWIEAMPGAKFKVLHGDIAQRDGLLSYLIKLESGFEMTGHEHPFDEECLMLEGDLTLGNLTLQQGDFHFAPAGAVHGRLRTESGCMAYIRGGLPA